MRTATTALFRYYRTIIVWFAVILVAAEVIVVSLVTLAGPLEPSMWLVLAGTAAKYWLLVAGIMLVSTHLRLFVANGATRHEFLVAAALFALVVSVGFAVAVAVGHALESAVLGALDERATNYPVFVASDLPNEVGRMIPVSLAYFVAGAMAAAGFYRFRKWVGVVLIIPALVPPGVADRLLAVDENGPVTDHLPYAPALLLALAATVVVGAFLYRVMSDIPIRRAPG